MTTINNKNITFTFRNKFEYRLVNDATRPVFMTAFENFCKIPANMASKMLWRLTYNSDFYEEDLQQLGLNSEIVPLEKISTLRDELRYQYNILHPGFLTPTIPTECMEAFTALKNRTNDIVAFMVLDHCYHNIYAEQSFMDRVLSLLGSNKENCFFGGLRELSFSWRETSYLMPYHMQIHDLLKALYDYNHRNDSPFKNTPFEKLDAQLKEAGVDLPFEFAEVNETPAETPAENPAPDVRSGFKSLTPENILEYHDIFSEWMEKNSMESLLQIGKIGFDLNKVIAKKESICNIMAANAKLVEAENLLHQAEAVKKTAEEDMFWAAKALEN